jgi:hypothetical protein
MPIVHYGGKHEPVLYTENLFVKFIDRADPGDCTAVLRETGLAIKQQVDYATNAWFVQAPEGTGQAVFEIAAALLARDDVEFCHPELIRPRLRKGIAPQQWHLHRSTIGGVVVDASAHVEAFKWAADHGADLISCSWGPSDGSWWDASEGENVAEVQVARKRRSRLNPSPLSGRGLRQHGRTACALSSWISGLGEWPGSRQPGCDALRDGGPGRLNGPDNSAARCTARRPTAPAHSGSPASSRRARPPRPA